MLRVHADSLRPRAALTTVRPRMSSPSIPPDAASANGRRLVLYVAGSSQRAQHAMAAIRRIVEAHRADDWTLEVIDVLTHPQDAARAGIVATPTVIAQVH